MSTAVFPAVSPAASPWPVGRTRRHTQGCMRIHSVRADAPTEAYLAALIGTFAGAMPGDSVNASILFRRAMQVYYRHVSAMLANPHALADERLQLIRNTHLPYRSRKGEAPHAGARTQ